VPITPFLGDQQLDPETKRVTDVAFEIPRAVVERDWGNYADGFIARRIIALAKGDERNPDVLCGEALKGLSWHGRM